MNKFILISTVVSALLFTACGEKTTPVEETKKVVVDTKAEEANTAAKLAADTKAKIEDEAKKAKEAAAKLAEETKAKAAAAAQALKDRATATAKAAKEKVQEKVAAVKDAVSNPLATVTKALTPAVAPAKFVACAGCHGSNGEKKAMGKSAIIKGQDKATLVASMKAYKAGTRNVAGMGTLMKGQVSSLSDADMEEIAEFISAK